MTPDEVLDILVGLFESRGVPKHIRSDGGPEFIAKAIREFLNAAGMTALAVEPSVPILLWGPVMPNASLDAPKQQRP
jgi:hypothetical protein